MKKKGFTLIEIIICIALISIIGVSSTVGITKILDNNKAKKIVKLNSNLMDALEVYLSNHQEVEENLIMNSKAAVVTLEVLKNEGLIEENLINPSTSEKFDYKNSYFTLLEGEVLENTEPANVSSTSCEYNQIGINIINSWDLKNVDSDNILYICPRKDYTQEIEELTKKVDELASKLEELKSSSNNSYTGGTDVKEKLKIENLFGNLTYVAKGINPNNYVEFEVNSYSSQFAYFPNSEDKNLWRIVSIDDKGQIKLFYPQAVISNNFSNYSTSSEEFCNPGRSGSSCTFYKLNHKLNLESDVFYKYATDNGYYATELLEDVTSDGSKNQALYNAIKNKNWIVSEKYFPYYIVNSAGVVTFDSSKNINLKLGMININEINESINISESWLYNYSTTLGYANTRVTFDDYYLYIYNKSGAMNFGHRRQYKSTVCTSSSCNRERSSTSHLSLTTYNYNPVITLNSKVELVEPTCSEGVIKGSKECPYKLTCKDC